MNKIIYFDGVCNLCNWSIRLVINQDKKGIYSFASLQSDYAQKHLIYTNGQYIKYNSVVYQEGDRILIKSDAVFHIISEIGSWWKVFLVFKILPKSWCDWLYDVIAKNRYRWFGKKDKCMVPTKNVASKFLS